MTMSCSLNLIHVDLLAKAQVPAVVMLSTSDEGFTLSISATGQSLHPRPQFARGSKEDLIRHLFDLFLEEEALVVEQIEVPTIVQAEAFNTHAHSFSQLRRSAAATVDLPQNTLSRSFAVQFFSNIGLKLIGGSDQANLHGV